MATSTEATVRDTIVAAIRAIATSGLGFDESDGNVKDYPIEFEHPEQRDSYLLARVGSQVVGRCWSVDVRSIEAYIALRDAGILTRVYTVSLRAFYARGVGGEGYRTIIDHARAVRQAIYNLGTNLSGRVTRMVSISPLQIGAQSFGSDEYLVGEFQYEFERVNPDW